MKVTNPHPYAVRVGTKAVEVQPGDEIELPEKQAKSLIAQGWKKKATKPKDED